MTLLILHNVIQHHAQCPLPTIKPGNCLFEHYDCRHIIFAVRKKCVFDVLFLWNLVQKAFLSFFKLFN